MGGEKRKWSHSFEKKKKKVITNFDDEGECQVEFLCHAEAPLNAPLREIGEMRRHVNIHFDISLARHHIHEALSRQVNNEM